MVAASLLAGRCQAIDRQHCQIEALVEALDSRFDSRALANRSLVSLLNSLAVHLQIHFELEEEDTYFSGVTRRAPRLAEQVDHLLREHEALQVSIDELVEMAREAFQKGQETSELASRFQAFREQLISHERAEIDLLQEAYTQDLGAGD